MGLFKKLSESISERFTNTKSAFQLIVEDFKRYARGLKIGFLLFSSISIIYNLITKSGSLVINISLLVVLYLYAFVDTILRKKHKKQATKKVRKVYAWTKILLNAAALGSNLYALYSATSGGIKPLSIVLATLSIIMFVLKVLVEICYEIIQSKFELLKSAMIMDSKEHPKTAGRLFSPIVGDAQIEDVKDTVVARIKGKQSDE